MGRCRSPQKTSVYCSSLLLRNQSRRSLMLLESQKILATHRHWQQHIPLSSKRRRQSMNCNKMVPRPRRRSILARGQTKNNEHAMSQMGHFRPIRRVLPAGSCLLRLKADLRLAAMTAIVAFLVVHVSSAVLVPKVFAPYHRAVKKRNRWPVSAKRHPALIRSS